MINFDVTAFLLCFARIASWAFTAPVISAPSVPPRVRVGIALSIAALLAPLRGDVPDDRLFFQLPPEILLGLVAGFASRLALAGIEAAGQLIGMLLGIGFGAFFDPTTGEESLPTRRIAYYLAAVAFLGAGGLEESIRAMAVVPVEAANISAVLKSLVDAGAQVFVCSLRASAPIVIAALITNLAGALAARAAPAMNAFSVMLALFLVTGGAVLYASAPAFVREVAMSAERAISATRFGL